MENERKMYQDMERIFFTKEQIAEAVKKLGQRITEDYAGKAPVMVCILKGASLFFADLIREIDLPLTIDFMVVSSYGASTVSSGEVRLIKDLDRSIMGKRLLYSRGANSMKIATLLDKPARRVSELTVDYSCFVIPDAFVVGYGLDYDEVYRNLPEVGILSPSVYENK